MDRVSTLIKNHYNLLLLIIPVLYIMPLISANQFFADDLWRIRSGYTGFMENGRFAAEWLYKVLSSGDVISDIYPFSQLFASILIMLSGYLLSSHFSKDKVTNIIGGLAFLIMPFFIEPLSFRFDAITMAAATIISVLSFTKFSVTNKGIFSSFCLVIFSLGFYQPALSIVLSLPLLYALLNKDDKILEVAKNVTYRYLTIIVAYLFYVKVVLPICGMGAYASEKSKLLSFNHDSLGVIFRSLSSTTDLLIDLLMASNGYLYIIISLLFIATPIINFLFLKKTVGGFFVDCLCILSLILLIYFPLSLLENPVIMPRTMIGMSVIFFISLNTISVIRKFNIGVVISLLVAFGLFMFMPIYSNALYLVGVHNNNFSKSLGSILNLNEYNNGKFFFSGKLDFPTAVIRSMNKYPVIKKTIQHYYIDSYILGYDNLALNGTVVNYPGSYDYFLPDDTWHFLSGNNYGRLFRKNDSFLFEFLK